jgi:hypothetical protein
MHLGGFVVVPALAAVALGVAAAAEREQVPLYTGEDLDRMFGPAPSGPSDPVDKTRPEDWRFVEQFLDREYARIDAERHHDLSSREVDVSARPVDEPRRIYGGSLLWGGYPVSPLWNVAGPGYRRPGGVGVCDASVGRYARATGAARVGSLHGVPDRAMGRGIDRPRGHSPRHQ